MAAKKKAAKKKAAKKKTAAKRKGPAKSIPREALTWNLKAVPLLRTDKGILFRIDLYADRGHVELGHVVETSATAARQKAWKMMRASW